jgi:uncharacterized protein YjbJ (UPF0337 family)
MESVVPIGIRHEIAVNRFVRGTLMQQAVKFTTSASVSPRTDFADKLGLEFRPRCEVAGFFGVARRPLAGVCYQEHVMSINKDQVKGRVEEVKGGIKEAAGKVVGDTTLEAKGNIQKNLGKVQAKVGDIKRDLKHS